ncbi:MAG: hypothetical protein GY866_35900 [Proteobacteria bacterium]|nr:hypothetical protein [Pseudomonadota bacterium]
MMHRCPVPLIALLFACVSFFFIETGIAAEPVAQKGILDLEDCDLDSENPVELNGEWEFYWNRLLFPKDFKRSKPPKMTGYIEVPGYWNGYEVDGKPLGGEGYATFRLVVKIAESDRILGLDLPAIHTSYLLWADGRLVAKNGVVGKTKENAVPQYLTMNPRIETEGKRIEFVLQVSNFSHARGGIWQTLRMGTDSVVERIGWKRLGLDMFLIGCFLIMGLYHFGLYLLRKKEKSPLYFGLFCLLIALRVSLHDSNVFAHLFPYAGWEFRVKLDYFTFYFGLAFICTFAHSLFPDEFSKKVLGLVWILSAFFIGISTITPAMFFTAYLIYYQAIIVLSSLYICVVLVRSAMHGKEEAIVVLGGCVAMLAAFVNDVLYNQETIHTAYLFGFGLLALVFSQSVVISMRFSKAFTTVEILSARLELKVRERTAAIKDLLDNSGQGFFSFGRNFRIQKYTSKATHAVFGKPIEDEDVLELMFPGSSGNEKAIMELVLEDAGKLKPLRSLLPSEIERNEKIYRIDYHWIEARENQAGRIMIVTTDVTKEKWLQRKLEQDEQRSRMIAKIAVDRHGFLEYLYETDRGLAEIDQMLDKAPSDVDIDLLFRRYHTLKGGLASYFLTRAAEKVHEIESELDVVRQGKEPFTPERVTKLKHHGRELRSILQQNLDDLQALIPKELQESNQNVYHITESKIAALEEKLKEIVDSESEVGQAIGNLRKQPVRSLLKKYAADAEQLAGKLGKEITVRLEGEETEIVHEPFKQLFYCLIHLIRNAVDHGIEPPEIRESLGKPKKGTLTIGLRDDIENLILSVSDDGSGIDREHLKKVALEKGLFSPDQLESMKENHLLKLITEPGFSTKTKATELSGRGMGIDAVAEAVESLQGTMEIVSRPNEGTTFRISVPSRIVNGSALRDSP